jgi:proline iminopeptidase
MMSIDPLYPASEPRCTSRLSVGSSGHNLYYAEFGDPQGVPALFLHGGPGSGCNPKQARLFNPDGFRLIQLDQRGCGQSRPLGGIQENHIDALLDDMEALRRHLAIDRWLIYGGSWGGTLALEYAKRNTETVLALVLRAPFLARREDLEWFAAPTGVAQEFPEAYTRLHEQLDCAVGEDLVEQLHLCLCTEAVPNQAYRAALAWDTWEATVMGLSMPPQDSDDIQRRARISRKRIFAHYCHNQFFLGDQGVLPGIGQLNGLTATIVHGVQDRVCRIPASEQLVRTHLPSFKLQKVEDAGHGVHSVVLQAALRQVLDAAIPTHLNPA